MRELYDRMVRELEAETVKTCYGERAVSRTERRGFYRALVMAGREMRKQENKELREAGFDECKERE